MLERQHRLRYGYVMMCLVGTTRTLHSVAQRCIGCIDVSDSDGTIVAIIDTPPHRISLKLFRRFARVLIAPPRI